MIVYHVICKIIESLILHVHNKSFPGHTGPSFESFSPGTPDFPYPQILTCANANLISTVPLISQRQLTLYALISKFKPPFAVPIRFL